MHGEIRDGCAIKLTLPYGHAVTLYVYVGGEYPDPLTLPSPTRLGNVASCDLPSCKKQVYTRILGLAIGRFHYCNREGEEMSTSGADMRVVICAMSIVHCSICIKWIVAFSICGVR